MDRNRKSENRQQAARETRQGGYVLLILLTMLGLSSLIYIARSSRQMPLPSVNRVSPITANALRQAKEALIAYAATTRDRTPGTALGYLPLPDMGGHITHPGQEGVAAIGFTGNSRDEIIIGRLPWNTLGTPPLKDEYGECLWYAVSGTYKNTPTTAHMNWDTLGYLDLRSPDGTPGVWGTSAHARPVAIIFSAGPPLPGQDRADSTETGDNVSQCHGNYNVRNYLDPYAITGDTSNFTNWLQYDTTTSHNALDDLAATVRQLLGSPLPGSGVRTLNDRSAMLTSDELFRITRRRSDFMEPTLAAMETCLDLAYISNGNTYPLPDMDTFNGNPFELTHRGLIPGTCRYPSSTPDIQETATQYDQHFFYFRCDNGNSSCLRMANGTTCKAAIVFGGARNATQFRRDDTERNGQDHPENYLESPALNAFNTGEGTGHVDLGGIPSFDPAHPDADVVLCLHHS